MEREEIIRRARINKSTWYRNRRVLIHSGLVKEVKGKYALWNYIERKGLWDRKKEVLEQYGGYLVELEVDRLERLLDRQGTNLRTPEYGKKETIKGIIVLRKAHELRAAAGVQFPSLGPPLSISTYDVALLTPDSIKNGDRVFWKEESYTATNVDEIFDGYVLGYRTAILSQPVKKK